MGIRRIYRATQATAIGTKKQIFSAGTRDHIFLDTGAAHDAQGREEGFITWGSNRRAHCLAPPRRALERGAAPERPARPPRSDCGRRLRRTRAGGEARSKRLEARPAVRWGGRRLRGGAGCPQASRPPGFSPNARPAGRGFWPLGNIFGINCTSGAPSPSSLGSDPGAANVSPGPQRCRAPRGGLQASRQARQRAGPLVDCPPPKGHRGVASEGVSNVLLARLSPAALHLLCLHLSLAQLTLCF